ncbi:hypothetical protein ACT17S_11380 [Glutamicibacter mysorens]
MANHDWYRRALEAERERANAIAQLEYEQANRRKEDAKLAHERDDFIKELETANTGMRSALEAIQELHVKRRIVDGRTYLEFCGHCECQWPCATRRLADQGLGDNLARTTKNGGAS